MASAANTTMKMKLTILFTLCVAVASHAEEPAKAQEHRAAWMEGKWGVRILLPGGDTAGVKAFDVEKCMAQLRQLDTASWVMINVTHGACGSLYTAPNPVLKTEVHPAMTPERDLLGEMLTAIEKAHMKSLVYFASEGPAKVKSWTHPLEKTVPGSFEAWDKYCKAQNMTSAEAIADKIIKFYSARYDGKISGWWFDHAVFADSKLFAAAARSGNPDAVVAFNLRNQGKVARGAKEDDVAFGHPTPLQKQPPSWDGNVSMIETIEKGPYVDGVLGHIFMPMQKEWWGKEPDFTTEKAVEWTRRVVKAKGAFTWAVALKEPHNNSSELATEQFTQLLEINKAIRDMRNNATNNTPVKQPAN